MDLIVQMAAAAVEVAVVLSVSSRTTIQTAAPWRQLAEVEEQGEAMAQLAEVVELE